MHDDSPITLNLLPIPESVQAFQVYRRKRADSEERLDEATFSFSLPRRTGIKDDRESYWIRFTPHDGYEVCSVGFRDNVHLTRRVLFHSLTEAVVSSLPIEAYWLNKKSFYEELALNFNSHEEGREQLTIQPYYLRSKGSFAWLVDYHFRMQEGMIFSRRVQQLSLSLNKSFKRNLDAYSDRRQKLRDFLSQRHNVLASITLPGAEVPLGLGKQFVDLPSRRLQPKVYIFASDRESSNQYSGLRQHGPLQSVAEPPTLLFAFREQDRQAARTLALALRGSRGQGRHSFPGFEGVFKTPLQLSNEPIVLPSLNVADFEKAAEHVEGKLNAGENVVPIFVLPEGDENGYLPLKATFTHKGIPTQVCTLRVINDDYALKWSVANIALQIFCKAGGLPWKVRPTSEKTLLIGISQSHKVSRADDGSSAVDKYFAFSVLTDNSGLFQELRVLGEGKNESDYLSQLRQSLRGILAEKASSFSRVVLHTTFRMKRREMAAIENTVRDAANEPGAKACRFAVLKVNQKTRFFGFNPAVNSLVPYEGSVVGLGGGEYLVWFEGISPDNPRVTKAFPGPTHVTVLRTPGESVGDDVLLQDLVNLSGCNWRGFNAKSSPVSVFYCHLVADLVHDFHMEGLPMPRVKDLRPWFL